MLFIICGFNDVCCLVAGGCGLGRQAEVVGRSGGGNCEWIGNPPRGGEEIVMRLSE